MIPASTVGERILHYRTKLGLTLRTLGDLSGISYSYLAKVERGEKTLSNRNRVERLALALRVNPLELMGPWNLPSEDPAAAQAHVAVLGMEVALEFELGIDPGGPIRPWPAIAADLDRLAGLIHITADYAEQGVLTPALLAELHATYVRVPDHRDDALRGMITAYSSAMWTTKRLGGRGLPSLAARAAQRCAAELGAPEMIGYGVWLRGDATGALDRDTHYRRAVEAVDDLTGHLDSAEALQASGMLHLSAALAAGARGDHDLAVTHVTEAGHLADRMDVEVGTWMHLWFGPTNVGIWATSLALELGDHGRAITAARAVRSDQLPAPARRAEFYSDYGRALVATGHRDQGLDTLLRAERLAPQRIRNDFFVHETARALLHRAYRHPAHPHLIDRKSVV